MWQRNKKGEKHRERHVKAMFSFHLKSLECFGLWGHYRKGQWCNSHVLKCLILLVSSTSKWNCEPQGEDYWSNDQWLKISHCTINRILKNNKKPFIWRMFASYTWSLDLIIKWLQARVVCVCVLESTLQFIYSGMKWCQACPLW